MIDCVLASQYYYHSISDESELCYIKTNKAVNYSFKNTHAMKFKMPLNRIQSLVTTIVRFQKVFNLEQTVTTTL